MDRIQIQLPPSLRADLQAIADDHEWSFAETIRRGGEILVSRYKKPKKVKRWKLPDPLDMGMIPRTVEELNALIDRDRDEHTLRGISPDSFRRK